MKKLIWILFVAVFFVGCATTEWVNNNKPKEAFYEDKLTCEELANRLSWQRYPQPGPITIHNTKVDTSVKVGEVVYPDLAYENSEGPQGATPEDPHLYSRRNYREECFTDCLRSKGWFLQEVK